METSEPTTRKRRKVSTSPPNTGPATNNVTPQAIIQLQRVSFDFSDVKRMFAGEGRVITLEFNNLILVACYVPNTGDIIDSKQQTRQEYRVNEWDKHMKQYLNTHKQRKPVIYCGDMNIGHLDIDMHNSHEKRIIKQSAVERAAHSELLGSDFQDTFRYLYPGGWLSFFLLVISFIFDWCIFAR
jgi:exodeoxyribonuclease III